MFFQDLLILAIKSLDLIIARQIFYRQNIKINTHWD